MRNINMLFWFAVGSIGCALLMPFLSFVFAWLVVVGGCFGYELYLFRTTGALSGDRSFWAMMGTMVPVFVYIWTM